MFKLAYTLVAASLVASKKGSRENILLGMTRQSPININTDPALYDLQHTLTKDNGFGYHFGKVSQKHMEAA